MSTPSQNPFEPSWPASAPPEPQRGAPEGAPPPAYGSPSAPPPAHDPRFAPAASPAQPPAYGAPPAPMVPAAPPSASAQFAAPYAPSIATEYGIMLDEPLRARSSGLGRTALVLSLVAAVVLPIVAAFLTVPIGTTMARASDVPPGGWFVDLSWATPVANQVLWAELSFYAATGLGIAALVTGIMAIAQRRGRGAGITAVVLAVLGPLLFGGALFVAIAIGARIASS